MKKISPGIRLLVLAGVLFGVLAMPGFPITPAFRNL
jgi:hypothetical protein